MDNQNTTPDQEQAELQSQLRELADTAKSLQIDITKAVEGLTQAARGTVSMLHFKDLKTALDGHTELRSTLEKAKKLIKAKLQSDLKE